MSLRRMVLRDFIIVDHLDLELHPGFSVLTGETGAGKSILIDALQLVLGSRADAGVVREGAARCDISAEFDPLPAVHTWLEEQGFEQDLSEPLLLRRVIDTQGRSRAWVNGHSATATQLRWLSEHLVDIHGQHAWQSLTRPDRVRALLDDYGRVPSAQLLPLWQTWRQALDRLDTARQQQSRLQEERERLQWQIGEVDKLSPGADEWDELNLQHGRLAHAQGLMDAARQALDALSEGEPAASQLLHQAVHVLHTQQHIEPRYAELAALLEGALEQIKDACHDLQAHADADHLDPSQLEQLDQRLASWMALARRFRCSPPELPQRWAEWQRQLEQLERSADLDTLQAQARQAEADFRQMAAQLSVRRAQAATALSSAISAAMQGLGMAGGRFEVQLTPLPDAQSHGLEAVEFLVAGHAGVSPRPVARVASGGELSRMALAISVVTSELGSAPTLIFDEVDSGIGGAVAQTVGQRMQELGRQRQVLAVTHLPQVAACADRHLLVSKHSQGPHTCSTVTPIDGDRRVSELSRMLSGDNLSVAALAHAREMLNR